MQTDTSPIYLYIGIVKYEYKIYLIYFISILFIVKPLEKSMFLFQQITGFFHILYNYTKEGNIL